MKFNLTIKLDHTTGGCDERCCFLDLGGNKEAESTTWCLLFKEEVILIRGDQWTYDRCITCKRVVNDKIIKHEILNSSEE